MLAFCLLMASGENLLANDMPKYGPTGNPYAVPLSQDHKYLQNSKHLAFDYWNIAPFYVHISPIGAYDKTHMRVLIMDVDREWYEPYWVSDERLLLAMSKKTEKYGFGGYLWIKEKSFRK